MVLGISALLCCLFFSVKTIILLVKGVSAYAIIYKAEYGRYIRYPVGERVIDIKYRSLLEYSEPFKEDGEEPSAINAKILYHPRYPKFYILSTFFYLFGRPILFFVVLIIVQKCLKYF